MMNFTKQGLNSIQANGKQQSARDDKSRNLYLLTTAKGTKTFYVVRKINNKTERIKIGRFPDLTIEQARRECANINQQIELGDNPNDLQRKKKKEITLSGLFNTYLENHIRHHKKNERDSLLIFNNYLAPLHNKRLSDISKLDILALQKELTTSISERTSNKAITLLRAMFNRAIDWDIWDKKNPTQGIKKYQEKARERYLTEQEEASFFTALEKVSSLTMKTFYMMLFYTGARRGELMPMKWSDIHTENNITFWRAEQSKTGNTKTTPIMGRAVKLIQELKEYNLMLGYDGDYVFYSEASKKKFLQSPQGTWEKLCKSAEIENLRMHDIRHTGATWLSSNGASFAIIRDYLGHTNTSITGRYTNQNLKAQLNAVESIFDSLSNRLKGSL
jgi:integrase